MVTFTENAVFRCNSAEAPEGSHIMAPRPSPAKLAHWALAIHSPAGSGDRGELPSQRGHTVQWIECPRLTAAMVLLRSAVRMKGLAYGETWRLKGDEGMKSVRWRRRFDSLAKEFSTALSSEHEVGMKWKASGAHLGLLVSGIVVRE
ncbi:hypothetical protein CCGE525_37050 (plasmid) [Rhizobium jaguaris]|uniref:Uncharacterized protein n=1 Tax=Rhizobium jaguaris TaxID=1312183 RepID=A0A387FZ81_9HYPH|nr:hypothetical protein CCGE525_37050 [Rhizobium jaguaris]